MQTRLGLVEHQQRGGPRREQGRAQQEVAQRPVRQLGGIQRTQQAVLVQDEAKQALARLDLDARAGKGVTDGALQGIAVAGIHDRRPRGCQGCPVVRQRRSPGADLRSAGRGLRIHAEMVVEAPSAHRAPQRQQFGRRVTVGKIGHDALVGREALVEVGPSTVAHAGRLPSPVDQQRCGLRHRAGEDLLALDLGVTGERVGDGGVRLRDAEVDEVAEFVRGEAQHQGDRSAAHRALGAAVLRTRPEHGRQPAFARHGADDLAARRGCEKTQSAVEVGLARPVGAGDHGEPAQGHHDIPERAIAGDGEGLQHAVMVPEPSDTPQRSG